LVIAGAGFLAKLGITYRIAYFDEPRGLIPFFNIFSLDFYNKAAKGNEKTFIRDIVVPI